jgi:hypothetical protein
MAEILRSPEAGVLAEKLARAIDRLDHEQAEIHKAIDMLDPAEREAVASDLKSTLQVALITRLCHMTIGGMGMDDAQVNAVALDLLNELQGLGRDLQRDAKAARRAN